MPCDGFEPRHPSRSNVKAILLIVLSLLTGQAAADWPQWRGPAGTGVSDAKNLPTEFTLEKNLIWRVDLPGKSAATPVLSKDRLFVVSPDGAELFLFCITTDGKVAWKRKVGTGNRKLGFNSKNNFATPSPMTDGTNVYVVVGSGDMAAFDFDGQEIWHRSLVKDYGPITNDFGLGSSPLLWNDRIFFSCIHRRAESYVTAIDKKTGKELWKIARPTEAEEESRDAYSSPAIFDPDGGSPELIIVGADMVTSYDPLTGSEKWRHYDINLRGDKTLRIVVSPVVAGGIVYATSAKRGPVHAIKPGGTGDVTRSHRLWTCKDQTPDVATHAVAGDLLFMISEKGVGSCLDAKSGSVYWSQRVAAGYFGASPIIADGKLFLTAEEGKVYVLSADKSYKLLSTNDLGETMLATPVPADGRLYFRTEKSLLCIGNK